MEVNIDVGYVGHDPSGLAVGIDCPAPVESEKLRASAEWLLGACISRQSGAFKADIGRKSVFTLEIDEIILDFSTAAGKMTIEAARDYVGRLSELDRATDGVELN